MSNCQNIKNVVPSIIRRWPCGIKEVDWLYGFSKHPDGSYEWGLPYGSISLMCGAGGIGKSRIVVEICKSMCNLGLSILYCQNEMSDFGCRVKNSGLFNQENFYLTNSASIEEQLEMASSQGVSLIVVDSLSILDEYGNGSSDRKIKEIHAQYREYAVRTNCHILWLCHMNKEGRIKGRTTLTHLADTDFLVEDFGIGNYVIMRVGDKHRYGRTGESYKCLWTHKDNNVTCDSSYRLTDRVWSSQFGITPIDERDALYGYIPGVNKKVGEEPVKQGKSKVGSVVRWLFGIQ